MKIGDLRRCKVSRSDAHLCLPSDIGAVGLGKWTYLHKDDIIMILETGIFVTSAMGDTQTSRHFIKFLTARGIMFRFSGLLAEETEPLLT